MPVLAHRDDTSDDDNSSTLNSLLIAGIAVIGAIVVGLSTWLIIRQLRIRSRNKRENARGAAFLSVRGVVREGGEKATSPMPLNNFSRDQLTPSIILPDKVLVRPSPPAPPADIVEYHRQSGNFPRPSFARPFSFALKAGIDAAPRPQSGASWISFLSASGSGVSRFSVMSSTSSIDNTPTTGTVRKIRQVFNPILPDELLVNLGEKLTVVQSFDDGWCVVGKEGNGTFAQPKSLFKQNEPSANVEIGVVPAWCFLKPVVGLKGERPIRSSSLGITVQMEGPAFSSREEIISWSNF
ncbi:hypothetical protein BDP27DRAFT_1294023 [Rhodocollybia butyracea]|uniref:SH3 domain-containing protein n=1 Tax=Rhodocollybia butyracea TaxID=206335 RepID=A0A9P5U8R6_9AGAR|nr:hypothetical protein BDP27DRAFT_1294023 [Rhodocollybia butyracea]